MIKEHRQPPACRVTKSFTPLTRPGKRHTSSIVTCLHFARAIPQRDHKSFGQKAVFLRLFCGRREGVDRRLWWIYGRCSADKRLMCGQIMSVPAYCDGKTRKSGFFADKKRSLQITNQKLQPPSGFSAAEVDGGHERVSVNSQKTSPSHQWIFVCNRSPTFTHVEKAEKKSWIS